MKLIWNVTWKCNLRCKHCAVYDSLMDKNNELTLTEKIAVIDNAIKHNNLSSIEFLGGEPFLSSDFLQLYEYCQYKNLNVAIVTNGTLLTNFVIRDLLIKTQRPLRIIFSLDGPDECSNDKIRGHNSFKSCSQAISEIISVSQKFNKTNLISISIACTINKINVNILYKYVELCNYYKVNSLVISDLFDLGNVQNNEDLLKISDNRIIMDNILLLLEFYYNSRKNFSLSLIGFPKKIINHLNKKYSLNIDSQYNSCPLINNRIRIDPFGNVEKCDYLLANSETSSIVKDISYSFHNYNFNKFPMKELIHDINRSFEKNYILAKDLNCEFVNECVTCLDFDMSKLRCDLCNLFV